MDAKKINLTTSKFLNLNFALSACALLLLTGCSSHDEDLAPDQPVNNLYIEAKKLLDSREYTSAAKRFADVERQHPYSNWALRAQLMSAYSYYQAKKYDEAIDGFQTFIQLHPGHRDVVYAYYMIGLSYYEQIPIVQRDQEPAQKAQDAFLEITNRFTTSIYAKDANFKLDMLKDHLAAKEMDIGRFYLKQKSYIAAMNRFKSVIETYATTAQAPEAIYRLVECYLALGLQSEAKAAAAVLGHNHLNTKWYKDAYALLKLDLPLIKPEQKETTLKQEIESADEEISETNEELNDELNDENTKSKKALKDLQKSVKKTDKRPPGTPLDLNHPNFS